MKKMIIFLFILMILFSSITFLNNYQQNNIPTFIGDKKYDVTEDIDIPKVIFVYSDPTPHHPTG